MEKHRPQLSIFPETRAFVLCEGNGPIGKPWHVLSRLHTTHALDIQVMFFLDQITELSKDSAASTEAPEAAWNLCAHSQIAHAQLGETFGQADKEHEALSKVGQVAVANSLEALSSIILIFIPTNSFTETLRYYYLATRFFLNNVAYVTTSTKCTFTWSWIILILK